jgi:hypothetical protein
MEFLSGGNIPRIQNMNARLIASDEELLIVFGILFAALKEGFKNGKSFVFPADKFMLPEEKVEVNDKKKFLMKKTGERLTNFSYETEEANIDREETLRLLGVTLYHLIAGKSELTHESFLLDGYRSPIKSSLWPVIAILLNGKEINVEKIEEMVNEIKPDDIKSNIQPPQFASNVAAGKVKTADDIIRELANEKIEIIGHESVANFWGVAIPKDIRIRYSEETLRESIQANQNGEQWALAYYTGQSLRQMRKKRGINRKNQPCFYDKNWWLENIENSWATKTLEPGYYLLNYNGKFASKTWPDQEGLITELGPMYERAHEFVVGETILSNFNIHNGESLLENWYHWGREETGTLGDRVIIGRFDSNGLEVSYWSPGDLRSPLRVVIFRKFDF